MSHTFTLYRGSGTLLDTSGRRFDPVTRTWLPPVSAVVEAEPGETVDAIVAATWLQRESGDPLRVPIGVIGPREATERQLAVALEVGELLARCGFAVICGGRHG